MQTVVINQYLKKLLILDKIYKDDNKFGGMGNNFNFKYTIFLDKCRQVSLPAGNYIQSAFILLLGQFQTYYYANYKNTSFYF